MMQSRAAPQESVPRANTVWYGVGAILIAFLFLMVMYVVFFRQPQGSRPQGDSWATVCGGGSSSGGSGKKLFQS